ncbi:MAG: hypothetical protein UV42_C0019G0003 [Candidatus Magasanikbacteria bacterium GW2011_GWE2_42_7]|uniref:Uncharacterized protein n=1 Tax=Candidatus Magasanikbacteria bacterium GW2011_GWE2_42_7 TaxID=1619052 RepID=A0A0G1BF28_9BACT|nr:MAG: hypothetical protein UV42_C0019G0003 [Candidatus Magasanikbacteria bacterium GW2011_GWE2_42_7]
MFDANLLLRSDATDLAASETSLTGVDMGPDMVSQTYQVHVPEAGGTTPTLAVKIQESDDNSTWRDFLVFPSITVVGEYFMTGQSDARYRRAHLTLGGTTPDFGAVAVGPVPAGRHNKF